MKTVIELAQKAGFGKYAYEAKSMFERLVALVRADEREVCANEMAKIVMIPTLTHGALVKLSEVVNAIRARGGAYEHRRQRISAHQA